MRDPTQSVSLTNVITDLHARRGRSRWSEHVFYLVMALVALAITFIGFARTYFLRSSFHPEPLSLTLHVHGLAFTAWVLLLLTQTVLVATRRVDVHRALGWAGAGLAGFMVLIAFDAAVIAVHRAVVCCNADAARTFFAVPIGDLIVFPILVGTALASRKNPPAHKR